MLIGLNRDGTNKASGDGRDHQGSGRVGGSTKVSKLRAIPAKASTMHSGMTAVTFLADEEAWA